MTSLVVKPNHGLRWRSFDRMFDDLFNFEPRRLRNGCCHMPPVNIEEGKDDVQLTFEVPGMEKDDIKATVKDRVLTVSGKREDKKEQEDVNSIVSEIRSGSFSRSFTLPETVNADKIKADYKHGLLSVTLAKVPEVKPKEVEISVS